MTKISHILFSGRIAYIPWESYFDLKIMFSSALFNGQGAPVFHVKFLLSHGQLEFETFVYQILHQRAFSFNQLREPYSRNSPPF